MILHVNNEHQPLSTPYERVNNFAITAKSWRIQIGLTRFYFLCKYLIRVLLTAQHLVYSNLHFIHIWKELMARCRSTQRVCLYEVIMYFFAGPDCHRWHSFRGTQRGSSFGPDATHWRRRWVHNIIACIHTFNLESLLISN